MEYITKNYMQMRSLPSLSFKQVTVPGNGKIVHMSVGMYHAIFVGSTFKPCCDKIDDGSAYFFGFFDTSELASASPTLKSFSTSKIENVCNVTKSYSMERASYLELYDGNKYQYMAAGFNEVCNSEIINFQYGQLTVADTPKIDFFQEVKLENFNPIPKGTRLVHIEGASLHTMMLTDQGEVYMCGYNGNSYVTLFQLINSQLGLNVGAGTHIPTLLPIPGRAIQISCTNTYSLVLTRTVTKNRVYVMGRIPDPSNMNGAMYSVNVWSPTELQFPESITKIVSGPNFSIFYGGTLTYY